MGFAAFKVGQYSVKQNADLLVSSAELRLQASSAAIARDRGAVAIWDAYFESLQEKKRDSQVIKQLKISKGTNTHHCYDPC